MHACAPQFRLDAFVLSAQDHVVGVDDVVVAVAPIASAWLQPGYGVWAVDSTVDSKSLPSAAVRLDCVVSKCAPCVKLALHIALPVARK